MGCGDEFVVGVLGIAVVGVGRGGGGAGVGTLRRSIRRARSVSMMEEQSVLMDWKAAVEPYWVKTGADEAQYLKHALLKEKSSDRNGGGVLHGLREGVEGDGAAHA